METKIDGISNFNDFLEIIKEIIHMKGYTFDEQINENGIGPHRIFIRNENGDEIASIAFGYYDTGVVKGKLTKGNTEKKEINNIHISWLGTNANYRGQGIAGLLLVYAICYIKKIYPDVEYSTLDDDSDRNDMIKNLYNSLGYLPQGNSVSLNLKGQRVPGYTIIDGMNGPEKQLNLVTSLDVTGFINSAKTILKKSLQKGGKSRRSKKYRKNIKSRRSKKYRKYIKSRRNKKYIK